MVALNVLYEIIKPIANENLVALLDTNFVSALEGQIPKSSDCFSIIIVKKNEIRLIRLRTFIISSYISK